MTARSISETCKYIIHGKESAPLVSDRIGTDGTPRRDDDSGVRLLQIGPASARLGKKTEEKRDTAEDRGKGGRCAEGEGRKCLAFH